MIVVKNRWTGDVLLKSDAESLRDANLRGANLRDANLLCQGDMREIKTMQFEKWRIGWTSDTLQIGCQRHTISEWRKWDTEDGRVWIAKMDDAALEWADKYLKHVLAIIDAENLTIKVRKDLE